VDYTSISVNELVKACLHQGEACAWEEFVRRVQPLIAATALRTARRWVNPSPQQIDDLVQEVFLHLCADDSRLLRRFSPNHEGAIFGYIKVTTANLVHDHFKASASLKRGGGLRIESASISNASEVVSASKGPEAMERGVLIAEVESCLRSLGRDSNALRDRRIFWLYYRVGISAGAIAEIPDLGVGVKGVESILFRLTRQVRERLAGRAKDNSRPSLLKKGFGPQDSF
jgi:RNA polymerase sigma-70 factor (ECF subfamily)